MRAVNLLPREYQNAKSIRQEDPAVVVGSALGVIVMIALVAGFMVAHSKANARAGEADEGAPRACAALAHQKPTPKPVKPIAPITPIVPPPAVTGQEATWLVAVSTNCRSGSRGTASCARSRSCFPSDVTLFVAHDDGSEHVVDARLQRPAARPRRAS